MAEIVIFDMNKNLTTTQQDAVKLHYEIMADAEAAATAMLNFCKGLKRMRDEELYTELGFENFEDYTEKMVGLKQRQAYNYIAVLERLGGTFLQSNAKLGIEKLRMLSEIPWHEREEVLENNDVENMSTRQMQELTKKYTAACEQLSMLTEERDSLKEQLSAPSEEDSEEITALKDEVERLKEELENAESETVPAESQELDALQEEIDKLKKQTVEIEKDKQKAIAAAEKAAKKEAREQVQNELKVLKDERAKAVERLSEMEKQVKVAADPNVTRFSFYFDEVQHNIQAMQDIIADVGAQGNADTARKLSAALLSLTEMFKEDSR
ncbi:MAG: DUF3102 domain-containing protein [Oscillospiraceae bacterium]|jgi:DNA repair exonuclease SbcCD ATPase subunit|nr:DUF3102 domain-containing protein [Oscillospiraceae bacterium]